MGDLTQKDKPPQPPSTGGPAALKGALKEVRLTDFTNCKTFLQALYNQANSGEENYSYRQYSQDLGFSATNIVHLYCQGKRAISQKAAGKICEALDLGKSESEYFLSLAELSHVKSGERMAAALSKSIEIKDRSLNTRLEKAQLSYFSSFHHPVVREMVSLPDFQDDPKWIAARVFPKITARQAKESIDLLLQLQLLTRDKKGKLQQTNRSVSTGHEVLNLALKQYHAEAIKSSLQALATIPHTQRSIAAVTATLSSDDFEIVKQKLDHLLDEILELDSKGSKSRKEGVFQFNLQAFPVCKE